MESVGPIIWGFRLTSSQTPDAWEKITYGKGSWIIHMLRARLGDAQFLRMLADLLQQHRHQAITTEQFRLFAARYTPKETPDASLEAFFESWVYGTGIPTLRLQSSSRGRAPAVRVTVSVRQTGVYQDFSALVPVEIQFKGAKSQIHWIRADSDPAPTVLTLKQAPLRVALDPYGAVLAVKR